MAQNVQAAILMALLSSLGYPVYNETNKQNNPKPVKIVMECKCELDDIFSDEGYFVGGYYLSVKTHTEGAIAVIDSGRLTEMSIIPDGAQADDNLKIRRISNDQT